MQPRFRILHCLEYGKYGMTPTIDRADDVLHAYAMINISIMLLFTSLRARKNRRILWMKRWQLVEFFQLEASISCVNGSLGSRLNDVNVFAANRIANFHHSLAVCLVIHGCSATFHT